MDGLGGDGSLQEADQAKRSSYSGDLFTCGKQLA